MISSLLAGVSTTAWMLIGSRVLQGMSGAIFVPTLYSLIFSNFTEKNRGTAIGFFSLGVGLGAAVGPSFGGLLLKTVGWPWIFYINVPLTLLAMACILVSTSKVSAKNSDKQVLQSSTLILGVGLVIFMYTINLLNHYAIFSAEIIGLLTLVAALVLIFIFKEKHTNNPTIPKSLMLNKKFAGVSFAFAIEQFCFSSSYVALGLYMQNILAYSAYYSSMIFLALSSIFALISTFSGMIVGKVGINRPALLGFVLLAAGTYSFLLLPEQITALQLIVILLILGAGMGFAFSALNTGMMSTVKEQEIGIASSVFVMVALVGNALGVVISTLMITTYGMSVSFNLTGIISLVGAGLIVKMMRLKPVVESIPAVESKG